MLKQNQSSSVAQSCLILCDPTDCRKPGFPVLHHLPEVAQTHVHPTISSSVTPISCLSSFPGSESCLNCKVPRSFLKGNILFPRICSFIFLSPAYHFLLWNLHPKRRQPHSEPGPLSLVPQPVLSSASPETHCWLLS